MISPQPQVVSFEPKLLENPSNQGCKDPVYVQTHCNHPICWAIQIYGSCTTAYLLTIRPPRLSFQICTTVVMLDNGQSLDTQDEFNLSTDNEGLPPSTSASSDVFAHAIRLTGQVIYTSLVQSQVGNGRSVSRSFNGQGVATSMQPFPLPAVNPAFLHRWLATPSWINTWSPRLAIIHLHPLRTLYQDGYNLTDSSTRPRSNS